MKVLSALALAAALTLGMSLSPTGSSSFISEAHAKGKKGPGMCGTFNYWSGGKCVDIRVTAPKKK